MMTWVGRNEQDHAEVELCNADTDQTGIRFHTRKNHRNRCSDLSAAGRTWYSNTASAGYPETASAGEHGAADGHQDSGFPEEFTQIELQ